MREAQTLRRRAAKPKARPADLREFCGILSEDEARQMIRHIEEAFERVDAA